MWVRKRIDISWSDLGHAGLFSLLPGGNHAHNEIAWLWPQAHVITTLSVRSGFDLLLTAVDWPAGSEILISAVTIPDMIHIIEQHGYVPIPVDLDPRNLAICVRSTRQRISSRTKAILATPLFGARPSLNAMAEIARSFRLLLIEDGAQAYEGIDRAESAYADVTMFSFGPIKTATALGGGLVLVRDPRLEARMRQVQSQWPVQSRWRFMQRVLRYALLRSISGPIPFFILVQLCRWARWDIDQLLSRAVRNFGDQQALARIRQQPSPPLMRLLYRRLKHFNTQRLGRRRQCGRRLVHELASEIRHSSLDGDDHSFWVFPVFCARSMALVNHLRTAGFDATSKSQMTVARAAHDRTDLATPIADGHLKDITFLPVYPEMPDAEIDRLSRLLVDFSRRRANSAEEHTALGVHKKELKNRRSSRTSAH